MPTLAEIGCCVAHCGTCRELAEGKCPGCKAGYDTGQRDLGKARCKMKVCCINRLGTEATCADCPDYLDCDTIQGFYGKEGYKYKKYHESADFIRSQGYDSFMQIAAQWKGPYGKLR
jgi:hypothetical protein